MGAYENSNMPAVSWSALGVTRMTASDELNIKKRSNCNMPMLTSTIQAPGQRNHAQEKKPSAASKMQKAERLANAELIFAFAQLRGKLPENCLQGPGNQCFWQKSSKMTPCKKVRPSKCSEGFSDIFHHFGCPCEASMVKEKSYCNAFSIFNCS